MRGPRVRALYRALSLLGAEAPHDRAIIKLYYPARFGNSAEERNSGVVPADDTGSPYPVVIFLPGININPESYAWLAQALARQGFVCALPTMVAEEMPGYTSLTPGLTITELSPDQYGKRPSSPLIGPLLTALDDWNASGPLQQMIDTGRILLGGHSGGGSVALLNARSQWYPGLCGVFTYGAHAGAASVLGYDRGAQFALPGDVPTLMLGGELDGCIANSLQRYGLEPGSLSATDMVSRSFEQALPHNKAPAALAVLRGANHFSLAWPHDTSTGRAFLEAAETVPGELLRSRLLRLVSRFARTCAHGDTRAARALQRELDQCGPAYTLTGRRESPVNHTLTGTH